MGIQHYGECLMQNEWQAATLFLRCSLIASIGKGSPTIPRPPNVGITTQSSTPFTWSLFGTVCKQFSLWFLCFKSGPLCGAYIQLGMMHYALPCVIAYPGKVPSALMQHEQHESIRELIVTMPTADAHQTPSLPSALNRQSQTYTLDPTQQHQN